MKHRVFLTLAAALCSLPAAGQSLKPGLWEITSQVQQQGETATGLSQMQAELAKLPPEQRKLMEEMLAKQGIGLKPGGGAAIRVCITKEMLERNQLPAQQQGDCKSTYAPRAGNTQRIQFTCNQPPSSGEGQITYSSDQAYSMKMTVTGTAQGKPQKTDVSGNGKWVAADCGGLKQRP